MPIHKYSPMPQYDGKGQRNPATEPTVFEQEFYHPEPGTEALATWLEAPDGGDRRPERVLVKGYYGSTYRGDPDDREQVWFTTQEGEDLVHLTENVLFEPVPLVREELEDTIGWALMGEVSDALLPAVVDAILARFDVSFKEQPHDSSHRDP